MSIKLTPAYVKRILKKPKASVIQEDNLYLQIGSGKTKKIHAHFYWVEHGKREYRKLGVLRAESTAKECDLIQHEYRDLLSNWERGISPALLEKQTTLQRQHQEDELKRLEALKTVNEIWVGYFEKHLEGKSSANTRRYNYEKHIQKQVGDRPADNVDHQTLIDLVHQASKNGYEAGNTVSTTLATIGKYGYANGFLSNPRNYEGLPSNPKVRRSRVATDRELARLLTRGSVLIKAGIFLGQRAWNHLLLEWEEIDGDWLTIPPHKFKTRRHHQVYLSSTVHELFEESRLRFEEGHRNFDSIWIFAGQQGKYASVVTGHRDFKRTNVQSVQRKSEPISLEMRDIRRSCYTFVEEKFGQVVAGAIAGHKQDAMHRVYGQYDYQKEKQEAMLEWEKHLLNLMN